jgi:MoxR-like ATPase
MVAALSHPKLNHTHLLRQFELEASKYILDKPREIRLALTCLVAGGHLLIEDQPGMGKTTLVKVIAGLAGLSFNRIQFTNDMLPSDIIGSMIYVSKGEHRDFEFRKGPIFAELVLADELNRATPKTQSACLQAMEEYQISIDGQNHPLPNPFFVIATQNPRQNIGTFALPESQLDRFMMKISLGLPSREAERVLLTRRDHTQQNPLAVMTPHDLLNLRELSASIHMGPAVLDYLQNLVANVRSQFQSLSPRAVLSIAKAARAYALIEGREFVTPDDIQTIAVPTINHRLMSQDDPQGIKGTQRAKDIVMKTQIPL